MSRERMAAAAAAFSHALEALIADLEAFDQPERAPKDGGWSAVQIAWHVAETNFHVAGLLSGRTAGTKPVPVFAEDPMAFSKIPERVPTPIPDIHPPATITRPEAIARLRASEAPVVEAMTSLTERRGRFVAIDLPFGTINLYQLAEWAGAHVTRHRRQLSRLA